jgi:hypothetical protein
MFRSTVEGLIVTALTVCGPLRAATAYFQVNLASDISGLAANTDPNLKNP